MDDGIAEFDKLIQAIKIGIGPASMGADRSDEIESQTSEVAAKRRSPRVLRVQLAILIQQRVQDTHLARIRLGEVHIDSFIVQVSAVHLKLGNQGDDEASIQLSCVPLSSPTTSTDGGMDPLQLVEAGRALGVPRILGPGHDPLTYLSY